MPQRCGQGVMMSCRSWLPVPRSVGSGLPFVTSVWARPEVFCGPSAPKDFGKTIEKSMEKSSLIWPCSETNDSHFLQLCNARLVSALLLTKRQMALGSSVCCISLFLKSIHGRSDERVSTGKVDRFGEAFGPKLAPWGRRTQLDPHCVATRAHWTCARCCAEMGGTYVGLPWGWTLYQLVLNEPLLVRSLVRYILHHSINWLSMRVEMRAARIDIYMVHAASKIFVSKLLVSFLFCTAASFRHCKWEPIDFPSWCWAGFRGSMLRGSIYIARKCPGAVCCLALPGKEWKLLSPNWDLFFSLNPSGFFSRKDMCTFAIDATHMVPHDLTKTAHAPVAYLIASPKLVSKSSWLTPDLPFWCVASGTKPFSWWN